LAARTFGGHFSTSPCNLKFQDDLCKDRHSNPGPQQVIAEIIAIEPAELAEKRWQFTICNASLPKYGQKARYSSALLT